MYVYIFNYVYIYIYIDIYVYIYIYIYKLTIILEYRILYRLPIREQKSPLSSRNYTQQKKHSYISIFVASPKMMSGTFPNKVFPYNVFLYKCI